MKKLSLAVLAFFTFSSLMAQEIYIQAGKLIDIKNGKVLNDKTIIISGS